MRRLRFELDFQAHPAGSVLATFGGTRVICSVSLTPGVPRWMREQKVAGGWLTAEYQMLPGATAERMEREGTRGRPAGRSMEIQRLVGRSLRAMLDLTKLSDLTIYVDCDVLDADGGTRCAAVSGAAVALQRALQRQFMAGTLKDWPIIGSVAAVSVGMVGGEVLLDLCYEEDVAAAVDLNVVMTGDGRFVEVQGTAEDTPFSRQQLDALLDVAGNGVRRVLAAQKRALGRAGA